MIVWINGSFGSGKTSVAIKLNEMIENSHLYDPEEAGFYLRSNLPKKVVTSDFQDMPLWRQVNYQVLLETAKDYDGILIVPMTLVNLQYFDEIVGKLKSSRVDIRHYFLKASPETLVKRLFGRGEQEGDWVFDQIERCTTVEEDHFKTIIETDELTVDDVASIIFNEILI